MNLSDIVIDPELRDLLPPLLEDERHQLMVSVLRDGFRDPLVVWMNHGILVDGHHRLEIWQTAGEANEDKAPDVVEMKFADRDAVKKWIIENQLARRNLTDAQRVKIALTLKPAIEAKAKENQKAAGEKAGRGRTKKGCQNSDKAISPIDTTAEIAKAAGVSKDTVRKVQAVQNTGDAALNDAMDSGKISIHAATKAAKLPPAERSAVLPTAMDRKRKPKPLTDSDFYALRFEIEKRTKSLLDRIKKTSAVALRVMPALSSELRNASKKLAQLADEIDAKRAEG